MHTSIKLLSLSVLTVLMVSACGGSGGGTSTTVVVPVPAANNAPVVASPNADQTARVGNVFSYDATQAEATFSDADGDTLTYALSYAPAANGLTNTAGLISGTPAQSGTFTATITASDGNGGEASDSFDIVVSPAAQNTAPNIVFVISDDQSLDASEQYSLSADTPSTPNFTALANAGVIFDNAWVSPTCSPTRAALMTGNYSLRTNVYAPGDSLPATQTILQKFLKDTPATANYASAVIGKWHLGGGQTGPNDFGIDYFAGLTIGAVSDYFDWTLNVNGTTSNNTNYITTELTDLAIDWVGAQTDPWFLWLSYNAPHDPFHLPPSTLHNRTLSGTTADIAANPRPYFLAAIEAMDSEFGRFWSSLSAQEQANTVVVYLGDNGSVRRVIDNAAYPSGSKGTLFQAGISVPMFVSGAGVSRSGERESALVTHTDFFPTIAEIAGAALPSHNDGQSFAPLLSNAATNTRSYAYTEDGDGWTVRNARYKLIEAANGTQMLFDLQDDPKEQDDLTLGATDISAVLADLSSAAQNIRQ